LDLKDLESLSSELGALLNKKNYFFTTAESCTGGWVGQSLTSIPGSSSWYGCGFITYSNIAKHKILEVSKDTLNNHGAVSQEVVEEMVIGALKKSRANLGVAISGIAGPGGGTLERPVGTVCLAWKLNDLPPLSITEVFDGSREEVRFKSVSKALEEAISLLKNYN
jgi:nicotinamide-nucleotide amidase|tara:strand:+ start:1198 stop:1695 length:498 start_codon:yes stop_codon:yes gene_type:complete